MEPATPVIEQLFEELPDEVTAADKGVYDPETQTWSHRDAAAMSPVKHNQEM